MTTPVIPVPAPFANRLGAHQPDRGLRLATGSQGPGEQVQAVGAIPHGLTCFIFRFVRRPQVKRAAAERWVAAVNADGTLGHWCYAVAKKMTEINAIIEAACIRE